ncbi:MAG: GNAT family N-acetyltransferase [Nanoarchaeota archaeon]
MIIRRGNKKDIKELVKINLTAKKDTGWWIPQNASFYRKFIRNKNNSIYVAFEKDNLVGFLGLEFNKERKSTWINDIYVLREFRRNKIAKKLVQIAVKDWKSKSKSMVLLTADRNLSIFENLGFKKTMNFMEFERLK